MATTPTSKATSSPYVAADMTKILSSLNLGSPEQALNNLLAAAPFGPTSVANGNNYIGINHRQTPNAVQIHKDFFGLTFFTRPMMNFTDVNLRGNRVLTQFLNNQDLSVPRIVRCYLDHQLASTGIKSALADNQQAFIPYLTNTLESISGFPDIILPFWTSTPGVYKEEYGMADGTVKQFQSYDITATFRNIPGDPIIATFMAWLYYSSMVFEGIMVPYPQFIVENEIDYMTRIYRIILDVTKTKVQGIAACGAAFPTSVPIGAKFDYEHDKPINAAHDRITIPFKAFGMEYNDPILVDEFNKTVQLFNGGMTDANRSKNYTLVPLAALQVFNFTGYPRINPDTYILEWWVPNATFNQLLPIYSANRKLMDIKS